MATLPTNRTTSSTAAEHVSDHNTVHGLWNVLTTKGDLLVATAAQAYARLAAGTNGYVLTADSTVTEGVKWAAQSGTYEPVRSFKRATRVSGDIALGATVTPTWANVDTGLDMVLNAVVGDLIEYGISGLVSSAAVDAMFDVATIVGGSPVTYFSNGTGTPPAGGASGWYCPVSILFPLTGTLVSPALVSGDLSAGTVTVRLRYTKGAATAKTLYASAGDPLVVWARNVGPIV